jgi:hypothetical protein
MVADTAFHADFVSSLTDNRNACDEFVPGRIINVDLENWPSRINLPQPNHDCSTDERSISFDYNQRVLEALGQPATIPLLRKILRHKRSIDDCRTILIRAYEAS